MKPIRKAVLPVAGLGTRFLPATKCMPKEMLPVVDKPLIQYAIEEAYEAGIEAIMLVTGRGKNLMEDHFDHAVELEHTLEARGKLKELDLVRQFPAPSKLMYTRQQAPLGLGHAIWCAREFVGTDPFAVILPDDLVKSDPGCLKQMMDAYAEVGGNIVAVTEVPRDQTNKYGILDVVEDDGRLASAIAATLGDVPFHGLRYKGRRFDCGSKSGFVAANLAYALDCEDLADDVRAEIADIIG